MLEVLVLGPLEVRRDGTSQPVRSSTHRLLLSVLAAERPGAVTRGRLVEALWDEPPPTADRSLQAHVSRLRRRFGPEVIETTAGGYRLGCAVDAEEFAALVADHRGGPGGAAGLDRALSRWRGRPFGEAGDHRFLVGHRRRLEDLWIEARLLRARARLAAGEPALAVAALEDVVGDAPLHEGAWTALVEALAAAGRVAEALRAAQQARARLGELGLEPTASLAAAERAAATGPPPSPSGDQTPSTGPARPLPRPLTDLVGRAGEAGVVAGLLGRHRCVTLLGPGGVGKTRLALEVARRASGGGDGTWFCDLATVTDPADVPAALARCVGASVAEPIEDRLAAWCHQRSGLLVLDNCEHVVDAVVALVEPLLAGGDELTVLSTSRTRLGVEGEVIHDVAPLPEDDAVELFKARAVAGGVALDDDEAVAGVCRRLDGLPLAIEMAAARARVVALPELAGRLDRRLDLLGDDRRPARHQTMGAVVAWSYEALDPELRRAFEHLSVFAGEFTLEAADSVLERSQGQAGADAVVAALTDRSLLVASGAAPARFRMLDTVRAHAASRLARSPDHERAVAAHVDRCVEVSRQVGSGLQGPDEASWAAVADRELPDLRAAHRAAIERGWAGAACAIPAGLFHYVYSRLSADIAGWARQSATLGAEADGATGADVATCLAVAAMGDIQGDRLAEAAAHSAESIVRAGSSDARRFGHIAAANVAVYQGRLADAVDHATTGSQVAAGAGDLYLAALGDLIAAIAWGYQDRPEEAERELTRSRHRAESVGAPTLLSYVHYADGEIRIDRRPEAASAAFDRAVAAARAGGSPFALGIAILSAASVRARHGHPQSALPEYEAAIRHWRARGDWIHVWTTLRNLGVLLERLGDDEGAAAVLGAAAERTGGVYGEESRRLAGTVRRLRQRLGDSAFARATAAGQRLTDHEAVEHALGRCSAG